VVREHREQRRQIEKEFPRPRGRLEGSPNYPVNEDAGIGEQYVRPRGGRKRGTRSMEDISGTSCSEQEKCPGNDVQKIYHGGEIVQKDLEKV